MTAIVVPGPCIVINPQVAALAVGRELRCARLDLKWTRRHAVHRVPGIARNSLYNHETGIRMCNLVTLTRLSRSMAVSAPDLLELAMQRMRVDLDKITLHVDLRDVMVDRYPPKSLQRWAAALLWRGAHRHGVVRVPPRTIARIAQSTSISARSLINYLAGKAPYSIRGSKAHYTRTAPDPDPPQDLGLTKPAFAQALGVEFRARRTSRSWTYADVVLRLSSPIDARNWYEYERGIVLSSVGRFIELGHIFGITAPHLLGRTLRRLGIPAGDSAFGGDDSTDEPAFLPTPVPIGRLAHPIVDPSSPHAQPSTRDEGR